jgi:DNA-binding LytR/AlgR family response regulator
MNSALWKFAALVLLLPGAAVAKGEKPKDHPLTGTVVSFHAQQEVRGDEDSVRTVERRVYVVKTDTGTLEITGWDRGSKASKRPPLAIGQTLTFRTDGKYIYIVLSDGKEHRYYILAAD